ncbi:hypothetical protein [Acidithiobacillus concretivorus]|uniref:DUF1640 domain-containing protein n=1 Tax=Acidithiobacillus concretivorus TaxID=3063952 RepID=A0ABS5ZMN5_9PROT|nr:hypothetical protein [Acidithiobacillus concretivorus]MBU2737872.1 hypothetical protein [Acidithiobacillus concretivorus]
MTIAESDLEQIGTYVRNHMGEWLAQLSLGKPPAVYEIELRERMVRVEEALHQTNLRLEQGFQLMEKRFEQIEKRFEQVDKRFELMEKRIDQIDKRIDQIDKRLDLMTLRIDRFMIWSFGTTVSVGAIVIAAIKLIH